MSRRPRITGTDAIRALQRGGFRIVRQHGSHVRLADDGRRVTVPVHSGETLKPELLASILRQAGLTMEQFIGLL